MILTLPRPDVSDGLIKCYEEDSEQLELPIGDGISDDLIEAMLDPEKEEKRIRWKKLEEGICPTCGKELEMTHHGLVCPTHGVEY